MIIHLGSPFLLCTSLQVNGVMLAGVQVVADSELTGRLLSAGSTPMDSVIDDIVAQINPLGAAVAQAVAQANTTLDQVKVFQRIRLVEHTSCNFFYLFLRL